MALVRFPYGKEILEYDFPDERFNGELVSKIPYNHTRFSQEELVRGALGSPIGSATLRELAKDRKNVVIIASDHTRPVPSKYIIPPMLCEIRAENPGADITILVATGCHRAPSASELEAKFGSGITGEERIVIHDCDTSELSYCGKMPSGGALLLNKLAVEADLLVSEGFIEPHFFAGFSGGRKSVHPGIAGRKTVLYNHNAEFIAHPNARAGITEGNPIHTDMLYAARAAKLAFICNVVINADKEIVFAAAGDAELAHRAGREFLISRCKAGAVLSDIAVTSNGGHPLDQNIYQAVKGMTAAEATVKPGGVIIMIAKSEDGHGAPEFYRTFEQERDLDRMVETFFKTPKEETRIDQWESQILARVLKRATVVYISDAPDGMVRNFHLIPAHSIAEAMEIAEKKLGDPNASVIAIPDGIGTVVS